MKKYVGRKVLVIYEDSKGCLTKRRVWVQWVREGRVGVYCLEARAFRVFLLHRLLAVQKLPQTEGTGVLRHPLKPPLQRFTN